MFRWWNDFWRRQLGYWVSDKNFLIPCFLWAWPGLADILRFASSFRNCKAFFLLQRWQTLMWSLAVALLTSVIFSLWAVHGQAVPLLNLLSATAKINENEAIANLFFYTSWTRHCLLFFSGAFEHCQRGGRFNANSGMENQEFAYGCVLVGGGRGGVCIFVSMCWISSTFFFREKATTIANLVGKYIRFSNDSIATIKLLVNSCCASRISCIYDLFALYNNSDRFDVILLPKRGRRWIRNRTR